MALIFVDGFEFYQSNTMTTEMAQAGWAGPANLRRVSGRVAGGAIAGSGTNSALIYPIASTSAAYMGWAIFTSSSASILLGGFKDTTNAANGPFNLYQQPGGRLTTFVGGVTVSTTPNETLPAVGAWRSLIVSVNSNNTTGSYKVLLEGVTVLQATGIDTAVSTVGVITRGVIMTGQSNLDVDDFYIGDSSGPAPYNANLGDCRVEVIRPTSDVSISWVPSTATVGNWINVADVSTSTSSFVETSIVGAREKYGMGNLTGIPVTIYAVIPQMYQEKLDAGTLNLRFYTEVSGVTAVGNNFAPLVSAYRWTQEIMLTQPNGSAWDTTAVNAMIAGFETT